MIIFEMSRTEVRHLENGDALLVVHPKKDKTSSVQLFFLWFAVFGIIIGLWTVTIDITVASRIFLIIWAVF